MTAAGKVLIVDDDPDLRELLATVLIADGLDVEDAANGQEALDRMKHRRPDLILLDMRMPVMNGWELCAELDRQGDRPKIIVLTAATDPAQRAAEVRADGWLGKPFDRSTLRAEVARFARPAGRDP